VGTAILFEIILPIEGELERGMIRSRRLEDMLKEIWAAREKQALVAKLRKARERKKAATGCLFFCEMFFALLSGGWGLIHAFILF
jgi:hypothetical protein